MKTPTDDQAFDAGLRLRHADALTQVSASTQAQLHQRRRAALLAQPAHAGAARTSARRFSWPVAASIAALLALAVGVQMRQDSVPTSPPPIVAAVNDADEFDATLATLDESPDLYLWLASEDAVALVLE